MLNMNSLRQNTLFSDVHESATVSDLMTHPDSDDYIVLNHMLTRILSFLAQAVRVTSGVPTAVTAVSAVMGPNVTR